MSREQIFFDEIPLEMISLDPDQLMQYLQSKDLKRSIFSSSCGSVLTYYFGTEQSRDDAVARWRKAGMEIIGEKEKIIMDINDALRESLDYFSRRITDLQTEDNDMENRYDRMPEWAIKRQREIGLEVNRLAQIRSVMKTHLNQEIEAKNVERQINS